MDQSSTIQDVTPRLLVVACALATFLAQPVAAQTAGNLKCKGCVSSKEIKNKGIKSKDIKDGQVKNADLGNSAVDMTKLTPEVRGEIVKNQTFFGVSDTNGEVVTLATNGPLTIFMRCTINDGGFDEVEVSVTSSLSPWYSDIKTTPAPAGDEGLFGRSTAPTNTPMIDIGSPFPVFAADGSAFSGGASVTTALNLAGHRCLAYGDATALKGEL